MTPRYTIALDCDGVLFDCESYVRKLVERLTGRPLTVATTFAFDQAYGLNKDEMNDLHKAVCSGRATLDMQWLPGAIEFVDALRAKHDVYFLTSHWREARHWVTDREARLHDAFPGCDVVFTHNKTRAQFDYLVDDKVETILSVGAAGVLFDQPWNQHAPNYVRRVKTYEETLQFINRGLI